MPELAEVEFFRRQWESAAGQQVLAVQLHETARIYRGTQPRELRHALPRTQFQAALSHGKQLLFAFSSNYWLGAHLGMSGQLLTAPPDVVPGTHDHLILTFPTLALVFRDPRQFGRIRFDHSPSAPLWWRQLPPEILGKDFTLDYLQGYLQRHPRSPLKPLLLDQNAFPGIGNWMADEILWRSRLHPTTPAGSLQDASSARLWTQLRAVSHDALMVIGENWGDPPLTWLFPHRWKDGNSCPAPQCGAQLLREPIRGRTTCWCPRCQPEK